ncbi:MAG: CatA-like O-acetyltransferase [Nannocystaceae bacterium]
MPTELDLERWPRRAHFDFFRGFESPFFNVCAHLDATALWRRSGAPGGPSFALACFWLALRAANQQEPFRLRIRGDRVVVHEVIHGGTTALRDDDTFGFAYFDFDGDYERFAAGAGRRWRPRAAVGASRTRDHDDGVIHFSVMPWVAFTSISHARRFGLADSVPKVVLGKALRWPARCGCRSRSRSTTR